MEIIELSSQSDVVDVVDLDSDGEDSTDLRSDGTVMSADSEDDGYGDRSTRFRPPLHSLSIASEENSDEEPIVLGVDGFLRWPSEDILAIGKTSKLTKKDSPRQAIASLVDVQADTGSEVPEESLFSVDEKAVYEDALQYIQQEKREEDLPEGVLSVSLLKHQRIALAWMVTKENTAHCSGGILADDQGLGKTISTIALIQMERLQQSRFMSNDSECEISVSDDNKAVLIMDKKELKARASQSRAELSRPAAGTLVVCPASVLKQWANELSTKVTKSAELSVLVYHGSSRTKDPTVLADYDVVVTTYTIVAREVPKETNDEISTGKKMKPKKNAGGKARKKNKPGPLARVRWFRVVLDEAHMIKGHRTETAKGCCGLSAERRWCLSGTPIQNSIEDLYSYFRFLQYEPYSKFSLFRSMLKDPISRDKSRAYKKLQTVLRIVLLRRTKETLLDEEPIIKIPPKTIQLSKIDFTKEERAFYARLEEKSRQTLKGRSKDFIKKNYVHILALLSQLRQACNHPFLLRGKASCAHSLRLAKQIPVVTAVNLLKLLESGAAKCTKCGEPPKDTVAPPCGHVFCSKCVHPKTESEEEVEDEEYGEDGEDEDDEEDEEVYPPCPLCGGEISADNLLFTDVLKFCLWPNLESEASTSHSIDVDQPFSVCESSYISSKIRATIDILNSIINTGDADDTMGSVPSEAAPAKAIVFTQWTGMLDLLERSLSSNHIEFRRLDGSMRLNVRERAVKEFNTDPEVRVIIMSLKAGNLGLNMVAACHVLMLDPWWNPSAEDQAVDRAHRIGQTRPVTVSRLTVKDTVEDRILKLQEKKREMVESALGEDQSGSSTANRLTVEDLKYLFKM